MQQLYVNQTQAAAMLGVTARTVYNMEKNKLITRVARFKSARYSVEQIKKLAEPEPVKVAENE